MRWVAPWSLDVVVAVMAVVEALVVVVWVVVLVLVVVVKVGFLSVSRSALLVGKKGEEGRKSARGNAPTCSQGGSYDCMISCRV